MKRSYILLATTLMTGAAAAFSLIQCGPSNDTGDAGDSGGSDVKVPKDAANDVADGGTEAGVTPNGTALAGGDGIRIRASPPTASSSSATRSRAGSTPTAST